MLTVGGVFTTFVFVTVIRLVLLVVDDPSGPSTAKLTENVPAFV
jgi:hypothetical protein